MNGRLLPLARKVFKASALVRYPPWRRALRHRVAASIEHRTTPLRGDYRTVIDAGANRGQFALVARRRFPSATVECFEPLPNALSDLRRVFRGDPHVRVHPFALSSADGTADFHVAGADDSSSLLTLTDLQTHAFPGTAEVASLTVEIRRLDGVFDAATLPRPTLLKIDVQGAELSVLEGAGAVLGAVDTVLVECSFAELYDGQATADDVIRALHAGGFRLSGVASPTTVDGRVLQIDLVFDRD